MATSSQFGSFVPQSNVWDVSNIYSIQGIDPQLRELLVRLYQNINAISIVLNTKDTGYFVPQEYVCGQVYYPNPSQPPSSPQALTYRQVLRKVIVFGALPNTGTKSVPHNIPVNAGYTFKRIYGTATDPVGLNYIPLPYASPTLASNIELRVDAANVTITTGSNRSSFTLVDIVLEYITN